MLRDDIELLCGKVISGPLTPALFLLLKNTEDMERLCKDLNIERGVASDYPHRSSTKSGPLASGGLSLSDWLANNAKPVSL